MKYNRKVYLIFLLGISVLTLIFHLIIILKVIPYELIWGGRLKSDKEMYVFELISILINLLFLYVLLQKGNYVKPLMGGKTISVILWIFFAIFALNTIGNLFAETTFEKSFTIITVLNAVLIWLINKPKT